MKPFKSSLNDFEIDGIWWCVDNPSKKTKGKLRRSYLQPPCCGLKSKFQSLSNNRDSFFIQQSLSLEEPIDPSTNIVHGIYQNSHLTLDDIQKINGVENEYVLLPSFMLIGNRHYTRHDSSYIVFESIHYEVNRLKYFFKKEYEEDKIETIVYDTIFLDKKVRIIFHLKSVFDYELLNFKVSDNVESPLYIEILPENPQPIGWYSNVSRSIETLFNILTDCDFHL